MRASDWTTQFAFTVCYAEAAGYGPDLDANAASACKDTTGAACPGGTGDSTIPIRVPDPIVSVSADREHRRAPLSRGGRARTGFAALPEAAERAVATAAGHVDANNLNTLKAVKKRPNSS